MLSVKKKSEHGDFLVLYDFIEGFQINLHAVITVLILFGDYPFVYFF